VDGRRVKAACRLRAGQRVALVLPASPSEGPEPENLPLELLYEDEHLAAINKPPGMVVHPSKGHWAGTLASALAYHFQHLSSVGGAARPGIVHRLDRDTSGVLVVAKTNFAHLRLAAQFEARDVEKEYFAVLAGAPDRDRDVIDQAIGVHPYQREKMAIRAAHRSARDARTFYEVEERFDGLAAVKVFPKTGRTHQVRLHLAHIGCPVLCDRLYGGRARITRGEIRRQPDDDQVLLSRQALHARRLRLRHPVSDEPIQFESPLPEDLVRLLAELRQHRALPRR
jgi:23S rRNA pseudouridine1911/1915/1917 synthase